MKNFSIMNFEELLKEHKVVMVNIGYYERMNSESATKAINALMREKEEIDKYLNPMILEKYFKGELKAGDLK